MDVTAIPYNSALGIEHAVDPPQLLTLPFSAAILNHLGTVHAAALFSLAEASSGEFLLRVGGRTGEIAGLVRKANCKYSAPASDKVYSLATTSSSVVTDAITKVKTSGRALIDIEITLHESSTDRLVARFSFTWFLSEMPANDMRT